IGVAIPTFWFAVLLVSTVYFRLGWAPPPGRLTAGASPPEAVTGMYLIDSLLRGRPDLFGDAASHMVLPAVVLATVGVGFVTRITRASMPAVMGVALVVGAIYVAVNLCVDLLYMLVNPRVRYG